MVVPSAFQSQLRGEIVQPGDAAYESARRVWNGAMAGGAATGRRIAHL